jgi:hypothetical protein
VATPVSPVTLTLTLATHVLSHVTSWTPVSSVATLGTAHWTPPRRQAVPSGAGGRRLPAIRGAPASHVALAPATAAAASRTPPPAAAARRTACHVRGAAFRESQSNGRAAHNWPKPRGTCATRIRGHHDGRHHGPVRWCVRGTCQNHARDGMGDAMKRRVMSKQGAAGTWQGMAGRDKKGAAGT